LFVIYFVVSGFMDLCGLAELKFLIDELKLN